MNQTEKAMQLMFHIAIELDDGNPITISRVKNVLEDGSALASMGISDNEQSIVESAHNICCYYLEKGKNEL